MRFDGKNVGVWEFQQQIGNALASRSCRVFYPEATYVNRERVAGRFIVFQVDGKYIMLSKSRCSALPSLLELADEVRKAEDVTTHYANYWNDFGVLGGCATLKHDISHLMVSRSDVRERAEGFRKSCLAGSLPR